MILCLKQKRGLNDGGSVTFVLKSGTCQLDTSFKLRASLLPIFPASKLRLRKTRGRSWVACVRACAVRISKQEIHSLRPTHAQACTQTHTKYVQMQASISRAPPKAKLCHIAQRCPYSPTFRDGRTKRLAHRACVQMLPNTSSSWHHGML